MKCLQLIYIQEANAMVSYYGHAVEYKP
jgi:hypothetical protein